MSNAIPFEDWLEEQGYDVRLVLCDGHPDIIVLVDKTNLAVYRYTIDEDTDGVSEAMEERMRVRASELGIEV